LIHTPLDRDDDVQPLAARRLEPGRDAELVEDFEHDRGNLRGGFERVVGWVDIDDEEVRSIKTVAANRRRVELECGLIADPRERRPVVADQEVDVPLRARCGDRHPGDPLRRVGGRRLLEVALAAHTVGGPDEGEWAVAQPGERELAHGGQVVDVSLLRDVGLGPEQLVRPRDLDLFGRPHPTHGNAAGGSAGRYCGMGPLRVSRSIAVPEGELRWRFSHSSGPGGQGVNTADSRVELSLDVANTTALGPIQRKRALERLSGRLVDGVLTVRASEHRSQYRNREEARERLAALLARAVAPPPPRRKPTKPSRAAVERRLAEKRRRAQTKRLRRAED
jgi:ribosome-associated protein